MNDCNGKVKATVLMLHPAEAADKWEQTDLWRSAAVIPGVSVNADEEGRESQHFGAATSGQALLYAVDGRLLFAGGITESRGHSGDNAGRSAVCKLVHRSDPGVRRPLNTPVYGCPLFDQCSVCPQKEGK
jgi:hypothetical protein